MAKRHKVIVISIALVLFVTGCIAGLVYFTKDRAAKSKDPNADVDISTMSSTATYSEVLNIMTNPKDYENKKIKAKGLYTVSIDADSGRRYTYCLIQDATKCCAQGLLFTLKAGEEEKLPAEGSIFTIIGTLHIKDMPDQKDTVYVELDDTEITKTTDK